MATEQMVFQIRWREAKSAQLMYLIDNGKIIIGPESAKKGIRRIAHSYEVSKSPLHRIEWLLWFEGSTLTKLVAEARRSGKPDFVALNKEDESETRWESTGAL